MSQTTSVVEPGTGIRTMKVALSADIDHLKLWIFFHYQFGLVTRAKPV
jgi:hypothetical protein